MTGIRRVVFAFGFPDDYEDPIKMDMLSTKGQSRVDVLHKRLTQDFFPRTLGRVKIFSEFVTMSDLQVQHLSNLLGLGFGEMGDFVDVVGLFQEIEEIGVNKTIDTPIFYLSTEGRCLKDLANKWNDMRFLAGFEQGDVIYAPTSPGHLAIIIDYQKNQIDWVSEHRFARLENRTAT